MSLAILFTEVGASLLAAGALAFSLVTAAPHISQAAPLAGAFLQNPAATMQAMESMAAPAPTAQPAPQADPEKDIAAEAPAPEIPEAETAQTPAEPQTEEAPAAFDGVIPDGCGPVLEQHYGSGEGERYIQLANGSIKNCTSLSAAEVAEAAAAGLPFQIEMNSSEPQVLIMHTHATESYLTESPYWYALDWGGRTTEQDKNMCAVGQAMTEVLNAAGVNTIHNETLHDYPSYNGSYDKSRATVQQLLQQYPSIKVVLDVHRDAIEKNGAIVAAVNGEGDAKTAQVMVICGCDKGDNLPNFKQNLAFAAAWQNQMEADTPGLTRPVLFDYRFYNQDLTTGSLLIEIGGHGNTLSQAIAAGQKAASSLAALFAGQP